MAQHQKEKGTNRHRDQETKVEGTATLQHGIGCSVLSLQVHACWSHFMKVNIWGEGMSLSFSSWRGLHHNNYRQDLAMPLLLTLLKSKLHIKSKLISSAQHMAKAVYIHHPTFNVILPPLSSANSSFLLSFLFFAINVYTHFLKHSFWDFYKKFKLQCQKLT